MKSNILGYPRIGQNRELKKACEAFWKGNIDKNELFSVGKARRKYAWDILKSNQIDYIPSNDFSNYDQVLDHCFTLGAIPERYALLSEKYGNRSIELYFAMARGYQKDEHDIVAMEMTKWFDTNYHYMVPEFSKNQTFCLNDNKPLREFLEAKEQGIITKPVLISPVSFLLLGKGDNRLELLPSLLKVYREIIQGLVEAGATSIQIDEPFLALDIDENIQDAISQTYIDIKSSFPDLEIMLTTYFEGLGENVTLATSLPVGVLHIDLVRNPEQLESVIESIPEEMALSLGVVDGRNIWKNDFQQSLRIIKKAQEMLGESRVIIGTSCSLLHSPYDLEMETNENSLPSEIKQWMAYARQKVKEVAVLKSLAVGNTEYQSEFEANTKAQKSRQNSTLIHRPQVKTRVGAITSKDSQRKSPFADRKKAQQEALGLPLFPTTTIGSFPQTKEVRKNRADFKRGNISLEEYENNIEKEIESCIKKQEELDIDVLVHGEFERNDMVEYFGEKLEGFAFSKNGWVQSYGSRGVKPPIIFGDVERLKPMTVRWSKRSQEKTNRLVKGMLTGPVTILQWSFVRNDQPRKTTAKQIALAIRDEVMDLEKNGIKVIQIDEPAIREGLPLRKNDQSAYLKWAVEAFRVSASGVEDQTQIHTHMCYSEFNEIIQDIADMDADVITIETSRSHMELLEAFKNFEYPNEIGPGVYDIHSPRVPKVSEVKELLDEALKYVPKENLWSNPDCGLKTRGWDETLKSLENMVEATKNLRGEHV